MTRYKITSTVRHVAPEKIKVYKSGFGPEAVFEERDIGKWRISLEGVGALIMWEKPDFKEGDTVNIIIEGGPRNA